MSKAISYTMITKGKGLNAGDFQSLLKNSYNKDLNDHNDFQVDRDLSGQRAQVYHNPKTNQVVIAHRGTSSIQDWGTNAKYFLFNDTSGNRFKHAEKVQNQAHEKYGGDKSYVTIGHSLGKKIAETVAKPNEEVLTYNGATTPYDIFKKQPKNTTSVRTSADIVSALDHLVGKSNKSITIKSKNPFDVLGNHNTKKLGELDKTMLIGNPLK